MPDRKDCCILAVGDTFLKAKSSGTRPMGSEIESILLSAPCTLMNLETVLAGEHTGHPLQKAVNLRVSPEWAQYLREIGVDVVNLANNHSMDYGVEGLQSTCAALDDAGIKYVGLIHQGKQHPCVIELEGLRIGILGYADTRRTTAEPTVAPLDRHRIQEDIDNLRLEAVDRILINLHWGEEYVAYPAPWQQRFARELVDVGTDIIIGHHPHVVQGVESYGRGLIFYSLGNFNFGSSSTIGRHSLIARWGIMVSLDLGSASDLGYQCTPVHIDEEYRPCLVSQKQSETLLKYLRNISEPLVPEIGRLFWLREASWPYFHNHVPSFIRRIRRYGLRHAIQMLRWLVSPHNYGFYLGLLLGIVHRSSRQHVLEVAILDPGD